MQLSTALGGILGACFAICAQSPKGAGKVPWDLCRNWGEAVLVILVYLLSRLCCLPWLCLSNNQSFPYLCRRNSSLDPPFHFWRISVHCLGKCCAWSPGGKESLVSTPSCSAAAILAASGQGYNLFLCLFWKCMNASFPNPMDKAGIKIDCCAIYCICGTTKTL